MEGVVCGFGGEEDRMTMRVLKGSMEIIDHISRSVRGKKSNRPGS